MSLRIIRHSWKRLFSLVSIVTILIFPQTSFSESAENGSSFAGTFLGDLGAPFTTPARWVFWSGLTGVLFLSALEDKISDPFQAKVMEDPPLGRYAKLGDYGGRMITNAMYIVGMAAGSYLGGGHEATRRAILMLKATAYSGGVSTVIKTVVRERRPNDANNRNSFPSGHTTSAFAFASVVGAEHAWYLGLGAYTLATFVAFSRINDNKHYLHDVVAGAVIGASYGLGLYYRSHEGAELSEADDKGGIYYALLPSDRLDGARASLFYEF